MRAAAGAAARSPKLETRRQHRLELLLTRSTGSALGSMKFWIGCSWLDQAKPSGLSMTRPPAFSKSRLATT
jgi:hypothetical protein